MAQRNGLAFLYLQTGKISPIMPIEADMTDNRFTPTLNPKVKSDRYCIEYFKNP